MWDVTDTEVKTLCTLTISTHTSRVGCDGKRCYSCQHRCISTHTSRVGCDEYLKSLYSDLFISTHTSRVGCDLDFGTDELLNKFLLTHPVWDVTVLQTV